MNQVDFDALLARRDDLQRQHERACQILEEEPRSHYQYRRCTRLYDELAALQKQIDDEIAAERAAENAG